MLKYRVDGNVRLENLLNAGESHDEQLARRVRRYRLVARQVVLLGWIIFGMAVVAVLAVPFATGVVTLPFGSSFSLSDEARAKIPPCPPSGKPIDLNRVKANIFNGSSRNGLAKETADKLKTFGVTVVNVGNAAESYAGSARITTGRKGLAEAFSLARALPDAEVRVDLSKGERVNVLLGEQFQGALSKDILGGDGLGRYPEPEGDCIKLD